MTHNRKPIYRYTEFTDNVNQADILLEADKEDSLQTGGFDVAE